MKKKRKSRFLELGLFVAGLVMGTLITSLLNIENFYLKVVAEFGISIVFVLILYAIFWRFITKDE